jgi:hypothetical protein
MRIVPECVSVGKNYLGAGEYGDASMEASS